MAGCPVVSPVCSLPAHGLYPGRLWLAGAFLHDFGRSYCPGIDRYPDACLRPFDPESAPEPVAEGAPVSTDA